MEAASGPSSWLRSPFPAGRVGAIGAIALVVIALVAIAAPWIAPFNPLARTSIPLLEPSWPHLFGTDELGRDIASRAIYGLRLSLIVAIATALLSGLAGVTLGLLCGYFGGWLDALVMRLMDVVLSIPGILLAIVLVSVLGSGLAPLILAIAIVGAPPFTRLTRASTLTVRERAYVLASRAAGASTPDILLRTILPNVLGPAAVQFVIAASTAILTESGLSFLGLGAPPPAPSLGGMLASGNENLFIAPTYPILVGLCIGALVASFDAFGAGLQKKWGGAERGAVVT